MTAARTVLSLLKPLLVRTLYREGAVRTIHLGPSRGLRYRIFQDGRSAVYGGWEREAQLLMARHIAPGQVAYDIGANAGIHTILMAKLVGATGHVYAFEPHPAIYRSLVENIALNSFLSMVTALRAAVSDTAGETTFFSGLHGGAGHIADVGSAVGERLAVETVTLDEWVFGGTHRPPSFMKIDVEGAESRVLSGGVRVLQAFRPVLLVDLHSPDQDVAVGHILLKFRYRAYRTKDGCQVRDLTQGWPDPNGLWGQFIAFPAEGR